MCAWLYIRQHLLSVDSVFDYLGCLSTQPCTNVQVTLAHAHNCPVSLKTTSNLRRVQVKSMPLPYSVDFRWRIVWLSMAHKMIPSANSRQMCISERSVRRYLRLFQLTGDVKQKSQCHGPQPLLGEFEQLILLRLIAENTGIYLH